MKGSGETQSFEDENCISKAIISLLWCQGWWEAVSRETEVILKRDYFESHRTGKKRVTEKISWFWNRVWIICCYASGITVHFIRVMVFETRWEEFDPSVLERLDITSFLDSNVGFWLPPIDYFKLSDLKNLRKPGTQADSLVCRDDLMDQLQNS